MILGDQCTRGCRFCAVKKGQPLCPMPEEAGDIAEAVKELGLRYVVVTSVTRDDLMDGGAAQFILTLRTIRQKRPGTVVEVLTPDFKGDAYSIDAVAAECPEVYSHNLETVPRLYRKVRPGADYQRSLELLGRVKRKQPDVLTKSGLLVGLGENVEEIVQAMKDLRSVGCDYLTIGQYLQPSKRQLEVEEFMLPESFAELHEMAMEMGFRNALCGPLVRSSYKAQDLAKDL